MYNWENTVLYTHYHFQRGLLIECVCVCVMQIALNSSHMCGDVYTSVQYHCV